MRAKFHLLAYATAVVMVVLVPQFTLSGIEARLFTPLGIAQYRLGTCFHAGVDDRDARALV